MKNIKILFALALAIAMLFTLVACNVCSEHIDENADGKCDKCGAEIQPSDDAPKGEQVTAEIWASELTLEGRTNYTVNSTSKGGTITWLVEMAMDDTIAYMYMSGFVDGQDYGTSKAYWDLSTHKVYALNTDGTWDIDDFDDADEMLGDYDDQFGSSLALLIDKFEDATFDATTGTYSLSVVSSDFSANGVVKFVGGKLQKVEFFAYDEEDESGTFSFTFGQTSLTLPEIADAE